MLVGNKIENISNGAVTATLEIISKTTNFLEHFYVHLILHFRTRFFLEPDYSYSFSNCEEE